MTGKGSRQRPYDQKKFNEGWELAFGKKNKEEKEAKKNKEVGEKNEN